MLFFLVFLFLVNYSSVFYDYSLFILVGNISKMYLYIMDVYLISVFLNFLIFINRENNFFFWVKFIF